ncbi:MAG: oligosaccharide flippase family protein [Mucilaginibacter polytrichastri]|nr:oligosaccharide flippase family protein [Mucilaginibacter polytrichastri]
MRISLLAKSLKNRHFLSLAGNGIMAGFSLITNALLYRLLSEREMGSWVLYQSIFMLIDAFRTGFLQTALIKFYSGADEVRKNEIAGATWYIAGIITAICVAVNLLAFLGIGFITNESLLLSLKWFSITMVVTLPFSIAFWILQAEQRFDRILYIRIITQGSFILGLILVHFFSQLTLKTVVLSFVISSLIASIVSLLCGWAQVGTFRFRTKSGIADVFHFGKFSVGSFISTSLLRNSGTFIVSAMLGPVALAIYNLPSRLLEMIEILIRSFASTGMSSMSAAANQNRPDEVVRLLKKYSGLITAVLIPVVFFSILLAPYFVLILGGGKYADGASANIFRIMVTIALLYPLDRFLGIALDTIHKPQINFIKVVIMLAVNSFTVWLGITLTKNVYGVAFASLFTVSAGMIFSYYMLKRYIRVNLKGLVRIGYLEIAALSNTMYTKIFKKAS